ncbi:S-adenosyl-l-methionine hydroxide adenosyltransferase [Halobacteriales archaeon QS_8_69_26]|nr:MAG: S-adenosyl-l-methionine hydroxide adenosyltransferase [Halobacteriales archaeon QS_8_69_26]
MITLASDFGSPYPAAMKAVALRETDAQLVDVAHDLPRQDVRAAAFWLTEVLPWFPPAVHLAVIDPGVGTDRNALALRAGRHALVGPDNGVLAPVARAIARQHAYESGEAGGDPADRVDAFRIGDADAASSTFHGRDVFAPAAGRIHEVGLGGMDEMERLTPVEDYADLRLPDPELREDGARGEVLVVDGFGNVITNVPGEALDGVDAVRVAGGSTDGDRIPVVETFARVEPGERLATVGSHGNVELDVNRGRGDEAFGLESGDAVELRW